MTLVSETFPYRLDYMSTDIPASLDDDRVLYFQNHFQQNRFRRTQSLPCSPNKSVAIRIKPPYKRAH